MKYFLAQEINIKPFIIWHKIANTEAELISNGEDSNPLVIAEEEIPATQFGVSPKQIVDGSLVDRNPIDMAVFESEFSIAGKLRTAINKIADVDRGNFTYAGNDYPMHEAARLRYGSFQAGVAKAADFMNTAGVVITVSETDLPAFLAAYNNSIQKLTDYIIA